MRSLPAVLHLASNPPCCRPTAGFEAPHPAFCGASLAGAELKCSPLAQCVFLCHALCRGCSPEPFRSRGTTRGDFLLLAVEKTPLLSPEVYENNTGVASPSPHPLRAGKKWQHGTMEISCFNTKPFAQACSFPAAGTGHFAFLVFSPVTQRSFAVLHRALALPDLLPPPRGPCKATQPQHTSLGGQR